MSVTLAHLMPATPAHLVIFVTCMHATGDKYRSLTLWTQDPLHHPPCWSLPLSPVQPRYGSDLCLGLNPDLDALLAGDVCDLEVGVILAGDLHGGGGRHSSVGKRSRL